MYCMVPYTAVQSLHSNLENLDSLTEKFALNVHKILQVQELIVCSFSLCHAVCNKQKICHFSHCFQLLKLGTFHNNLTYIKCKLSSHTVQYLTVVLQFKMLVTWVLRMNTVGGGTFPNI